MCGRFQASSSPAELARWFNTTGPVPNVQQRYNAAPTQTLPIVLRGPETGKRRLAALRWGLIPSWAGDVKVANELQLAATKALFDSIDSFPGHEESIERFCLPLFAKVQFDHAVDHVMDAM